MAFSNAIFPVAQVPNLYINNLQVSYGSTTTLVVQPGLCRNGNNLLDMNVGAFLTNHNLVNSAAAAITLDASENGINRLDTGDLIASSWYYIYALSDQTGRNIAGVIASLNTPSSGGPLLPNGTYTGQYSSSRLIAIWPTNSSAQFILSYVVGNSHERTHFYDTNISVLSSGAATSLTTIDLSAAVPPVDYTPVILDVDHTPATANDKASFTPYGSTATVLPHVTGSVAAKVNSSELTIVSRVNSSAAKILYINSAASGSTNAWVHGFKYFI